MMNHLSFSPRLNVELAYHRVKGKTCGVFWLGGFRSDMTGTKATALQDHCAKRGQAYVRFDYTGHGASSGKFEDGCIGAWLQDALDVFDKLTDGPQILVGSSMGGWIALLLAQIRKERVSGLIGIAAAPDFTEEVWQDSFNDTLRKTVMEQGVIHIPNDDGDPYPMTRKLFEDGRKHLLLGAPIPVDCPVRLIQGKKDTAVPWKKAERIRDKLTSQDVRITYIDDGDHRLSRPQDIAAIIAAVEELSGI